MNALVSAYLRSTRAALVQIVWLLFVSVTSTLSALVSIACTLVGLPISTAVLLGRLLLCLLARVK